MFFCTWGCLDAPYIHKPHTFVHPHTFKHPQGCTHPYMFPILLCICMFSEASACCGVLQGASLHLGHFPFTSPVWGAFPSVASLTKLLTSLCISRFKGYWYVIWGFIPPVGVWGVFPIYWGCWGHQHMGCPYAHSCTFL